jgi:hypothetical protein
MGSFAIKQNDILSLTLTARARACEHQAWRGGRHFHGEADCLPLLSLSIKLVCVKHHSTSVKYGRRTWNSFTVVAKKSRLVILSPGLELLA